MPKTKSSSSTRRARIPDLPHGARAEWLLLMALNALRAAHDEHLGTLADAKTLTAAGDVVQRTWEALRSGGAARVDVLKMASRSKRRRAVTKADVERRVLELLPSSVAALRSAFSLRELGDREGLRNVARLVFFVLGGGGHRDGARLRRRWAVANTDDLLGSQAFAEDVEAFASSLTELVDTPSRVALPERIVRVAYQIVGSRKPLDADGAKRRRTR